MKLKTRVTTLLTGLAMVLLGACTTTGGPTMKPLPLHSRVQVIAETASPPAIGFDTGDYRREAVSAGAGIGMVTGIAASAACGPFFFICMAPMSLIGGVSGGVAGDVYQAYTDISEEDRERLQGRLQTTYPGTAVNRSLQAKIGEMASENWRLVEDEADYVIFVHIDEYGFAQRENNALAIRLGGSMVVTSPGAEDGESVYEKTFLHTGQLHEPDYFLNNDSGYLEEEVDYELRALARQMMGDLL